MLLNFFLIVDVDLFVVSKFLLGVIIVIVMFLICLVIFKVFLFNVYLLIIEEYDKENGFKNVLNDLNLIKLV